MDANVSQRVGRLTLDLGARYHRQSAVDFFGIVFDPAGPGFRTADSDLAAFKPTPSRRAPAGTSRSATGGIEIYFALTGERYVRSNNLHVDFVSGALGWQQ